MEEIVGRPLTPEFSERFFASFCAAYRKSGWRDYVRTYHEWTDAQIVSSCILGSPVLLKAPYLYLVNDGRYIWRASGIRIGEWLSHPMLETRECVFYVVPEGLAWCLCRTEFGKFVLIDRHGVFGMKLQLLKPGDQP